MILPSTHIEDARFPGGSLGTGRAASALASVVAVAAEFGPAHVRPAENSQPEEIPPAEARAEWERSEYLPWLTSSAFIYLLKMDVLSFPPGKVEILCNGDVMGDDHSLTFIFRTLCNGDGGYDKVLHLKYRSEGEGGEEAEEV